MKPVKDRDKKCSRLYRDLIKRKLPATLYLTERLGPIEFKFYFTDGSKEIIEYPIGEEDLVHFPWEIDETEVSEDLFLTTGIKEKNG